MGGGASTNIPNQENKPTKDLGPEFMCRLMTKIDENDVKDGLYARLFITFRPSWWGVTINELFSSCAYCVTTVILRIDPESLSILDRSYKVTLIPTTIIFCFFGWREQMEQDRGGENVGCASITPCWFIGQKARHVLLLCYKLRPFSIYFSSDAHLSFVLLCFSR